MLDDEHRPLDRPPGRVVARSCCRGAYLRGAFLGGGSLTGPRSPHLEVRTPTPAGASFLRSVALGGGGAAAGRASARSHARAYAKGWEEIEGYLLAAGVVDAVLALEERSVVAEMRAEANRLANADHANLVRTARAAQRQLDAARRLRAVRRARGAAGAAARGGAAAPAPPGDVAARARRAREPAGDEGRACSGGSRRSSSSARRGARRAVEPVAAGQPPAGSGHGGGSGTEVRFRDLASVRIRASGSRVLQTAQAGWGRSSEDDLLPHVRAPRPDGERGLDPPPGSASPPGRV